MGVGFDTGMGTMRAILEEDSGSSSGIGGTSESAGTGADVDGRICSVGGEMMVVSLDVEGLSGRILGEFVPVMLGFIEERRRIAGRIAGRRMVGR